MCFYRQRLQTTEINTNVHDNSIFNWCHYHTAPEEKAAGGKKKKGSSFQTVSALHRVNLTLNQYTFDVFKWQKITNVLYLC
jgi:hypothetical protein